MFLWMCVVLKWLLVCFFCCCLWLLFSIWRMGWILECWLSRWNRRRSELWLINRLIYLWRWWWVVFFVSFLWFLNFYFYWWFGVGCLCWWVCWDVFWILGCRCRWFAGKSSSSFCWFGEWRVCWIVLCLNWVICRIYCGCDCLSIWWCIWISRRIEIRVLFWWCWLISGAFLKSSRRSRRDGFRFGISF